MVVLKQREVAVKEMGLVERRSRGKPAQEKDEVRRKVLEAAVKLLLEEGSLKFSIDAVARSGGIAKKTIYGFVSNREELVAQIVMSWTDAFSRDTDDKVTNGTQGSEARLSELLFDIYRAALSRQAVALYRLILADSEVRDRLAAVYNENGVEKGVATLAALLRAQQPGLHAAEAIARAMLAALVGEALRKAALGLELPFELEDDEVRRRVSNCVALFGPLVVS